MDDAAFQRFVEQVRQGFQPEHNGDPDAPPPPPLEALAMADFLAQPDEPWDPLLGPLIGKGKRLVVAAATGEGKSTLVMHMVAAIVLGERFLEWDGAGGRVLWIDAEQSRDDIRRLAGEVGLTDTRDVDVLWVPDGLELGTNPVQEQALASILEQGNYAAVVADPWYKLHMGQGTSQEDATRQTQRWDRWRTDHRFGLIVPMHTRKPLPGVPFSINDIYGDTTYVRGAEVILGLQLVSAGFSRLHFFKERTGMLPVREHWDLSYSKGEGYRVVNAAHAARERQKRDSLEVLRRALLDAGEQGMLKKQMMEVTGRAADWIERNIHELGDVESWTVKGRTKRWRLVNPGYDPAYDPELLDHYIQMAEED
jgi:hypothetical protein